MKSPYVSDLRPNELANGIFLVLQKDVRLKKTGEPYLSLVLGDRSGDVDSKMWDNVSAIMDTFGREDFVKVKGMPQLFQNRLQITVHTLVRVDAAQVDLADFLPSSKRDPEEMFQELAGIISSFSNPHLRALVEAIFADEAIRRAFLRSPAAKTIHHAWLGGLLEHVLSLCTLCRAVAPLYPQIDQDLLLAGAILHDIGKIEELTCDRAFGYSDSGQLLGHILIGLRIIDDKLRGLPEFPPRLRELLLHLIASHHGLLEYGSPKVPLFPEAMMLHMLDNLDSKMESMRVAVEKDKLLSGNWTAYVPSLEHSLLKKDQYLAEKAPAGPASEPRPPTPPAASAHPSQFGDKLKEALKGK